MSASAPAIAGRRLPVLLGVGVGGALGSAARYGLGVALPDPAAPGWPWTTFAINLTGTALLAALVALPLARRSAWWRAALGPGLLGGYTTFSATSEQARALLADDRPLVALGYLALTFASCVLAAVAVGRAVRERA